MNTNPQSDALRSRWTLQGRIPLSGVAEGAVWRRARTVATGEDVVLFIVEGETALEAADAVRRAYLVEDPHLLPVRDIVVLDDPREDGGAPQANASGEAGGGPITVVEYPLPSAPPLAALLAEGALHPETARAIVGEAASGLETARRRGVRHQLLDSNRVFVDTRSGAVTVLGVGVEAAAHPGLDRSREVASFQDTAALVALLYRALTGRSPRPGADGTVPRPSAVVDTPVPEDLDLLCDLVLNDSAEVVPETTRGLIEALEPWQSIPVTLEAYSRAGQEDAPVEEAPTPTPTGRDSGDPETAPATPAPATASPPAEESDPAAASTAPAESPPAAASLPAATSAPAVAPGGVQAPTAHTTASEPAAAESAPSQPAATQPTSSEQGADPEADAARRRTAEEARGLVDDLHLTEKRSTAAFPGHLDITGPPPPAAPAPPVPEEQTPSAAPPAAPPAESGYPARTSGTHWPLAPTQPASASAPQTGAAAAAAAAPTPTPDVAAPTPNAAEGPASPAADTSAPASRTGSDTSSSSSSSEPPTAPAAPVEATAPLDPVRTDGPIVVHGRSRSVLEDPPDEETVPASRSSLLRDVVGVAVDHDAAETFALGPQDREKRSLQSQWIIIGGAIIVMIALVVALTSITSDVREMLEDPLATSQAPETTAPAEEEETSSAPVEPTPTESEEPDLPAPEIANVELFEDGGGDPDHTDQQDRLTDGDPSTYWSTQHYGSPDFGGLHGGLGIRLQFAEPSTLNAVTLTTALNNGGTVELRALNDDGSLGDVLTNGEFVGDGEVRLETPEPLEAEQVALWITELPPDSRESGRFRARIAEIEVE